MTFFKRTRARRAERHLHNDRDVACRYWWGDRSGSAVGVMHERCTICNPRPNRPVPARAYDDERYNQAGR